MTDTPPSTPEQPTVEPDTGSDPGLDADTGSDWSDEGGATPAGPATHTADD